MKRILKVFCFQLLCVSQALAQGEQRIANLGECKLENGEVILGCRIGYRTWGVLKEDRSNAVLFPTWFTGTSQGIAQWIRSDRFVDPGEFFVVAVDAFGNGVSSSPSNSESQPGQEFPEFTIRDMVNAQYRLLTEEVGIEHLWAVMGISMGGLQTFEWLVSYPDFLEKAVPIVGSPQLGSYDLLLWGTQLEIFEQCKAAGCEDPLALMRFVLELAVYTPQYRNQATPPEGVARLFDRYRLGDTASISVMDYVSQIRAIKAHDVALVGGGNLQAAAEAVRADLLSVVSLQDHAVTPQKALEFTEMVEGTVFDVDSPCGHIGYSCESEIVGMAIRGFLSEGR